MKSAEESVLKFLGGLICAAVFVGVLGHCFDGCGSLFSHEFTVPLITKRDY